MCGIVAYVGDKIASPIIMKGLQRLEYRGYDSAGIAILNGGIEVFKKKGKVNDLLKVVNAASPTGTTGIGHTRWATHGEPNDINAHPHTSSDNGIALVHNGIIENCDTLREALKKLGHQFVSETDTEVLVHLISEFKTRYQVSLEESVRLALEKIIGAYAIVVVDKNEPDLVIAAKKASPLVIGLGKNEFFLASDATPLIEHTREVVYLQDEEMAILKKGENLQIKSFQNEPQKPSIVELDLKIEELEKGGFPHFMLKEIHQQPETISDGMRGRLNAEHGWTRLGGMEPHREKFAKAERLIITGCGTSWHAGLIGEYLIEDLARLPVEVEYASELRYRNPIINSNDIVIALSQSGETADTLAALQHAKEKGAFIYGIVNSVGSSIARVTDAGSYIHAGPEIGVASTKAFTSQLTLLTLLALELGKIRNTLQKDYYLKLVSELNEIPNKVRNILAKDSKIKEIANSIQNSNNALYLGRGYNFPVALEGALKLKEISYIHAEGYPAAEMKHGPIALIDENMPVVVVATNLSAYDKIMSNIQEVKARKGKVISIITEGDKKIKALSDFAIEIPRTAEPLTPLLSVIPLQLLSYHIAVMRGCNVDQPRNLAKSVTVE